MKVKHALFNTHFLKKWTNNDQNKNLENTKIYNI